MPSSISGFKSKAIRYAKALLAICAVLILVFEIASVYLLNHKSATYARISKQYDDALKICRGTAGGPPSVLLVGNSLLLHGVELNRFEELTSSKMHLYPIFLEATGYYDWLYALHGLFLRGARPQVVVLGVGVNYFLENGVRQDYAPMMFFNARDTLAVASDLKLDRTAASNLLLAHSSTFWDTRSAIRMQVLNRIVPHLEDLFSLVNQKPAVPDGREFAEITIPRLERLRELCEANGARLIVLVPPTLDSENAVNEMTAAAQAARVEVSVPIDPATLSAKFYQPDGMHLNRDGAVLFTRALAKDLPEKVTAGEALAAQK